MTEHSLSQLIKASFKAVTEKTQHLLVILTPDRRIPMGGTNKIIKAVNNDAELFSKLDELMKDNNNAEIDEVALQLLNYPLLPCNPSSPKWKGSATLRAVLSNILIKAGFGRQGTKKNLGIGIGSTPIGWPQQQIPWKNFKGASRSK